MSKRHRRVSTTGRPPSRAGANRKPSFFAELRRRHVWRVAAVYAVTAWLLLQLVNILLPTFGAPEWVLKVLIVIFAIFCPVALVLAWAFELTPAGVRRTVPAHHEAAPPSEHRRRIGRNINITISVVLAAAVGVLAWQLTTRPVKVVLPATTIAPAAATAIPPKSIAVLPFENLSADRKNDYFVAGMQGLILTKLAGIGGIKVISRTSTMQYGSHPADLGTIGRQLGVATILEGSVQKAGNEVLINLQLIDAQTNAHLWAESYRRTLNDIFGVEGEVAVKVAAALDAELTPEETARLAAAPTRNQSAYNLFLRAEYRANRGSTNYDRASMKAAISLYRKAVADDPGFALAWARLSRTESTLAWFGGGSLNAKQLIAQARADAERALKLAPNLAAAHIALGYANYYGKGDYAAALKAFDAALALRPNDAGALAARGYVERRQGRFDAATSSLKQALAYDPLNSTLAFDLGVTCMGISRYADAETWFRRALALEPDNLNAKRRLSVTILLASGDVRRALIAAAGAAPLLKLYRVRLLTYQRKYREAIALLESVPDKRDIFFIIRGGPKALRLAGLYRLAGESARARRLFAQALPEIRAQLARQRGITLALVWHNFASVQLGLGHTAEALHAIGESQTILAETEDRAYGPILMAFNAGLYAEARRPDLAAPLLAKALTTPGIGFYYSPVLLWLDPTWDPIREDPGFQALLTKYAKYKPAVIYDATLAAGASAT
ncbi:MAG: tetratricopeptide repeat protein [Gammaproteobacteria bacterium]|nr:tetratricopeptide repeat protein [Gammaproteobacteria bacterium]